MTDKTPVGVLELLDKEFGGVFRGRPLLVSGPKKSGKTVAAFHFIARGLRMQEHCLILTAHSSADLIIKADSMGLEFTKAVEDGSLILLEYGDDVPGRHSDTTITLPPDSFMQLAEMIAEQAVARLVLDTCLPWVAVRGAEHLAEHVFSFIRSLDRMGVTTLLTMPRAASLAASRLYKLVEDQVPVSITLMGGEDESSRRRTLVVNKYLGMDEKVGAEIPLEILPSKGFVLFDEKESGQIEQSDDDKFSNDKVSFSNTVLDKT